MPDLRFASRLVSQNQRREVAARRGGIAWGVFLFLLAAPFSSADWLVVRDGGQIETRGAWKVEGRTVVFTDTQGTVRSLQLEDVDLEASEEATEAAKNPPPPRDEKAAQAEPQKESVMTLTDADVSHREASGPAAQLEVEEPPQITMYATSWCGYCRRARQLLNRLGAEFVEKDIEKTPGARREMQQKVGGRSGVPVLEIGGKIVRGYRPQVITSLVEELEASSKEDES